MVTQDVKSDLPLLDSSKADASGRECEESATLSQKELTAGTDHIDLKMHLRTGKLH